MSVNTHIELPGHVCIRDVANAIGILAGLPIIEVARNHNKFRLVKGVYFSGFVSAAPQCVFIDLLEELVDGSTCHRAVYGFESYEDSDYQRALTAASSPFWLAIGFRLIEFFGGRLICQDCGGAPVFEVYGPPCSPEKIYDLQPLRPRDLAEMASFSAYPNEELERHSSEERVAYMKLLNILPNPNYPP